MKSIYLLLILTCGFNCAVREKPMESVQSTAIEIQQRQKADAILQQITEIERAGAEERAQREAKIALDMTKAEARLLWGRPEKVNRTTTRSGTSEQWVYSRNRYLYFDNGVLTAIQDTDE